MADKTRNVSRTFPDFSIPRRNDARVTDLGDILRDAAYSIDFSLPEIRKKLERLARQFDAVYPSHGRGRNSQERKTISSIVDKMMRGPILLYALGMNGPAIVDLHGIVERYAARDVFLSFRRSHHPHCYR